MNTPHKVVSVRKIISQHGFIQDFPLRGGRGGGRGGQQL